MSDQRARPVFVGRSGGVGFGTGGVSPSGWGDPHEDARLGLLEGPALGLLAAVVPSAERAEIALAGPATCLVGNGVILIALRGRTLAAGSGAAGRPGLDQVPQQPAGLVAWLLVAVVTAAHGQRGDPDPESLQERSGQRIQRWTVLRWAIPRWAIPRWAVLRWAVLRWPIWFWVFRSSGRVLRVRSACRVRIRARRPGRAGLLLLRTIASRGACRLPGPARGPAPRRPARMLPPHRVCLTFPARSTRAPSR